MSPLATHDDRSVSRCFIRGRLSTDKLEGQQLPTLTHSHHSGTSGPHDSHHSGDLGVTRDPSGGCSVLSGPNKLVRASADPNS